MLAKERPTPSYSLLAVVAVTSMLLLVGLGAGSAESSKCNRAKRIVDHARMMAAEASADHSAVLTRLKSAESLCPSLADIYKVGYCSAVALGDKAETERFKRRAVFLQLNLGDLRCSAKAEATETKPLPGYVRQKYALVVGIGRFQDPEIPVLQFTAKDAADVTEFLITDGHFQPENVRTLTNEEATRANLLSALHWLAVESREDDLVVIYISSHGSPSREGSGLNGIGYIVTFDSLINNLYLNAIEYQHFAEQIGRLPARRLVLFLDTCFSGQALPDGAKALITERPGLERKTAEMFLSGEGTYVITSSKADERSWESETLQNSYFTYYLLKALRQSSSSPPTISAVFAELTANVAAAVARDKKTSQHPQLYPSDGPGDLRVSVISQLSQHRKTEQQTERRPE